MREQEGGKREGRRERGKERAEQEGLGREGCGCAALIINCSITATGRTHLGLAYGVHHTVRGKAGSNRVKLCKEKTHH